MPTTIFRQPGPSVGPSLVGSFLESWNGVSMLRPLRLLVADHHLYSDASGGFGCGAIWSSHWLQFRWPQSYSGVAIAPKELIPIVMACLVWGNSWQGQVVHAHCDNEAVVAVLNSGYMISCCIWSVACSLS